MEPTNGLFGKLRALRIPGNLTWKTPKEFIELLLQILVAEFPSGQNESTVVVGWETPTAEDLSKPWFRTDRQGTFVGLFYRIGNQWRDAIPVGTVRDVLGDPSSPPEGWLPLDGNNNLPDTRGSWVGNAPNQLYKAIFTGYPR